MVEPLKDVPHQGIVGRVVDYEYLDALFEHHLIQHPELRFVESARWTIETPRNTITKIREGFVLKEQKIGNQLAMLVQSPEGALLLGTVRLSNVSVWIAAPNESVAEAVFKRLERGKKSKLGENVYVKFQTAHQVYTRKIAIAKWETIQENYPQNALNSATTTTLNGLMRDFKPEQAGQLILFHGEPGTGKTTALRALGWEWRDWCSLTYITDPEAFFGGAADYMLRVLLSGNDTNYGLDDESEEDIDLDDDDAVKAVNAARSTKRERWQLLICEDTGELLSADARERSGQGLSRLLNIVDGMIGQGLRTMVLITTNEEIGKLHAAVQRPGRAGAILSFERFTQKEAQAWLEAHKVDDYKVPKNGMTLAELYSVLEGRARVEKKQHLGFAA